MYNASACRMKSRNFDSKAERQRTVQNFSPSKMKLNNLTSSFDNDKPHFDRHIEFLNNNQEKAIIMDKIMEEKPKVVSHK